MLKLFEVFHWYGVVMACWQILVAPAMAKEVSGVVHAAYVQLPRIGSLGSATFLVEINENMSY